MNRQKHAMILALPALQEHGVQQRQKKVFHVRTSVAVRRTEVSTSGSDSDNSTIVRKQEDPDKQCLLHNKPHPLKKCCGFRNKSFEERKAYLKEKCICFKYCALSTHVVKECNRPLLCQECNSDKHLSALHPGPPHGKLMYMWVPWITAGSGSHWRSFCLWYPNAQKSVGVWRCQNPVAKSVSP